MYARYRAIRGTRFYTVIFALQVLRSVLLEWYPGKTALLRAVMYESILADVEIATARTTLPFVGESANQLLLKLVVIREG